MNNVSSNFEMKENISVRNDNVYDKSIFNQTTTIRKRVALLPIRKRRTQSCSNQNNKFSI